MPDLAAVAEGGAPAGLPNPADNYLEARQSKQRAYDLAKDAREFHRRGLVARRRRDLTAEKYMMHVDGEGLAQYLDVVGGVRLRPTPHLVAIALAQNNQLRPILDNFVSHLTTQRFQVVVDSKPDRKSRESAMIDQAIINTDIRRMNWNALWAEAKYMAACAGFCPVHAAARDVPDDPYEAVLATQPAAEGGMTPMQGPRPISIDGWVGNPFDHVFNAGAKLNSLHRTTYGRMLPLSVVAQAFGRDDLKGSKILPSASTFQRIAQKWSSTGGFIHNTAALTQGHDHEETLHLIYEEVLPGIDPAWPLGRLTILALQGDGAARSDTRSGASECKHLWTGPLPAGRFSFVLVHSHHRFDDIHGKPYIGDVDDDQIELNQLETLYNAFVQRSVGAPLASSGKVEVETIGPLGDTLLKVEPLLHGGSVELKYLEQPARHMQFLDSKINRVIEGMYRKAGWQAASRGESAGESGKAIIALQSADDSIFGPITQRTTEEVEAYADLVWALRKEFMDVPMVIDQVGDDLAHLAKPYVDRTMMSERPPLFTLVSGFGTSTEAKAQQLLNMYGMVDAKGEQLIGTREIRKLWPDNSLFPDKEDPQAARERRPLVVNQLIRDTAGEAVEQFRAQYPQWQPSMADPLTAQVGEYVALVVDSKEPTLMDDDLEANIETLSLVTQDATESPVARRAAMVRQGQYWQWLAERQAAQQATQMAQAQAGGSGTQEQQQGRPARGGAKKPGTQEAFNPAREGGGPNAQSMVNADKQFERAIR